MWIANTNKKGLIDIIQEKNPYKVLHFQNVDITNIYKSKEELTFIWQNKPLLNDILPDIIIVNNDDLVEFFAWVNTYLNDLFPFTFYCKVYSFNSFSNLLNINYRLDIDNNFQIKPYVGLIVGEVLTNLNLTSFKGKVGSNLYLETFSFPLIKTILFYESVSLKEISSKINYLNKFYHIKRNVDIYLIEELIYILFPYRHENYNLFSLNDMNSFPISFVYEATSQIVANGNIHESLLRNLFKSKYILNEGITREKKVIQFQEMSELIVKSNLHPMIQSFVIAYYATQISPGELDYLELMFPFLSDFPNIVIFYCYITFLYPQTSFFLKNYRPLLLKIYNSLTAQILFLNKDSISFDEFKTNSDIQKKLLEEMNLFSENNKVKIELLPSIEYRIDIDKKNGESNYINESSKYWKDLEYNLKKTVDAFYKLQKIKK